MLRPYLVGWGYAFKAFFKSFRKSKIQRKFWRQLVKKKYYWMTTEERVESNKKCFGGIAELGKNMFPNGISKIDYRCDYGGEDWHEDDYISDDVREVLLQYKKDKAEGKLETTPLRDLMKGEEK